MAKTEELDLHFTGDYSLAESVALAARAAFVDDLCPIEGSTNASALDLAFPVEGSWSTVGVRVVEREGAIRATLFGNPDKVPATMIQTQLERMFSLDCDGAYYKAVCSRDTIVSELVDRNPGIRPVLFPSPYEAAARAIIGHGLSAKQAAALHRRLAAEHGLTAEVANKIMHGFPAPDQLAVLPPTRGLADRKIEQLRALGSAAAGGFLDSKSLRAMTHEAVTQHLLQLPGIGPFSAELIIIRGMGDPDAFPREEKRLQRAMAIAYDLGDSPDLDTLEHIANNWRPYRSWVGILLRNFIKVE